jgi:hypothetical protein
MIDREPGGRHDYFPSYDQVSIPFSQYMSGPSGLGCDCKACASQPPQSRTRFKGRHRFQDYLFERGEEHKKPPTDHFYFLCDRAITGYALNERQWGKSDM